MSSLVKILSDNVGSLIGEGLAGEYGLSVFTGTLTSGRVDTSGSTDLEPVASWWLAGGISASSCVAAYQPKAADDYGDSLINLANPGTNDASAITAPTWDISGGWIFNGSDQYLETGLQPAATWSWIVRFSNVGQATGGDVFGVNDGVSRIFAWLPFVAATKTDYWYLGGSKSLNETVASASGIAAATNAVGYLNAVEKLTAIAGWSGGTSVKTIHIGRRNHTVPTYRACQVQAIAFYNNDITAYIGDLTTAIEAL